MLDPCCSTGRYAPKLDTNFDVRTPGDVTETDSAVCVKCHLELIRKRSRRWEFKAHAELGYVANGAVTTRFADKSFSCHAHWRTRSSPSFLHVYILQVVLFPIRKYQSLENINERKPSSITAKRRRAFSHDFSLARWRGHGVRW